MQRQEHCRTDFGLRLTSLRRDVFVAAADGTRLYALDAGPLNSKLTPVLCLPGLTRNSRDFEPVVEQLSPQRRVIACDLRGRGRSGHADPASYNIQTELQDTLQVLDHLGVDRVALIGTSRGGLIGMLWAATVRQRLAGLFLNDIGPELGRDGLARILSYVGTAVHYPTWDEAARGFAAAAHGFKHVSQQQWAQVVRRIYVEANGGVVQSHDLALAKSLPDPADVKAKELPDLWPLIPALSELPVHVLRGENSDLLSAAVAERMVSEVVGLALTTVADRGHVPFLDELESVTAIEQWLQRVDKKEKAG